MIQDLGSLHFENSYHNVRPTADDRIISMSGGQILLGGEKQDIAFPRFAELSEGDRQGGDFTYLFAIGDDHFFLCRDMEAAGYRYVDTKALRKCGPHSAVYAGLVGMQLARWYEAHRFCGRCGAAMAADERERMMRCPVCGQTEYPKICPCVIVGVIHEGKILVSQYRGGSTDHYALIAGFAEVGETIEETAIREVYEETHLSIKNLRYYKCQPWPYSESLLFGFFAELDGAADIVIEEAELAMAKWVTPEEIFETPDDFSLTNEMLCKFKEEGKRNPKIIETVRGNV
ncbi:MAG: NAD(+) diphosphatase [Clostridiales bacterium]|nr:NAD(+) diphosphatase [Clostridiales bacterium]